MAKEPNVSDEVREGNMEALWRGERVGERGAGAPAGAQRPAYTRGRRSLRLEEKGALRREKNRNAQSSRRSSAQGGARRPPWWTSCDSSEGPPIPDGAMVEAGRMTLDDCGMEGALARLEAEKSAAETPRRTRPGRRRGMRGAGGGGRGPRKRANERAPKVRGSRMARARWRTTWQATMFAARFLARSCSARGPARALRVWLVASAKWRRASALVGTSRQERSGSGRRRGRTPRRRRRGGSKHLTWRAALVLGDARRAGLPSGAAQASELTAR